MATEKLKSAFILDNEQESVKLTQELFDVLFHEQKTFYGLASCHGVEIEVAKDRNGYYRLTEACHKKIRGLME